MIFTAGDMMIKQTVTCTVHRSKGQRGRVGRQKPKRAEVWRLEDMGGCRGDSRIHEVRAKPTVVLEDFSVSGGRRSVRSSCEMEEEHSDSSLGCDIGANTCVLPQRPLQYRRQTPGLSCFKMKTRPVAGINRGKNQNRVREAI